VVVLRDKEVLVELAEVDVMELLFLFVIAIA
jgi:hypothetical protein